MQNLKKGNNMKKYTALLILTALISCKSYSQNTGYMGKHFLINAEANFSPAIIKPNSYGKSIVQDLDYFAFNFILTPSIEAIVWKKGTVGLGYNFFTSHYKVNYWLSNDYSFLGDYNLSYHMKTHGFHLFYKQYVGDTYAPLGHYFKCTFDVFFNQCVFNDILPDNLVADYKNDPRFSNIPKKAMLSGMKIEYGYDFLFFNRLKLSTGISLGTTFGGYKASLREIRFSTPPDINGVEPIEYGKTRLLNAYWLGLKVGIGLLTI